MWLWEPGSSDPTERELQVLNMKPPEILGLLEEAAGTKMYESKKQAALRTLEKKQIKLDEITKVRGRQAEQSISRQVPCTGQKGSSLGLASNS